LQTLLNSRSDNPNTATIEGPNNPWTLYRVIDFLGDAGHDQEPGTMCSRSWRASTALQQARVDLGEGVRFLGRDRNTNETSLRGTFAVVAALSKP
jgi:hypothetical protein